MKRFILFALCALPVWAQEYKIAVIGMVHSHVWGHLDKMIKGQPAKLVGIAETIPDLVAEGKKRGVPEQLFYSDYKKMLDETKPDIVWAFVENNRHLEIAQACAPRGIHILFEKPLASSYKEAATIRDLAAQHNIRVLTNYQMAWWPSQYAAKAQADSGALGKVWRLHGIVGHGGPGYSEGLNKYFFDWLTDPVKNGAGALVDFGCYNALWGLWYLGMPDTVYAATNRLQPERFPKVEDNAVIVLHYPNGVGIFEASWDLPRGYQDLEVFGRDGSVYMTDKKVEVRKKNGPAEKVELTALAPDAGEPIAAMIAAIKGGKPVEGLTAIDINVNVARIMDAAKESVRTGRAVGVK